jgi:anti-sigma regulatory factor (Ser/Thr protein kinase)
LSPTSLHGAEAELTAFRHEAFLYAGAAAFLEGTVPFIEAGLDAGEPVLVVVGRDKLEELCAELGRDAARVSFADMAEVGRNPARIIPAWRDFLTARGGGRPARGIGEPVYSTRTADELAECQRHEALLNVAFAGGAAWRLLCPYDTASLAPEVVAAARHSHRFVNDDESPIYRGDAWTGPVEDRLPEPSTSALPLAFGQGPLEGVRRYVVAHAAEALGPAELSDLLVAVTEVAGNSLMHGGGAGTLRVWNSGAGVVCDVRDRGWIRQPLVGGGRTTFDQESGRGLWMVNQLCDLVQIRSSPADTVVRLHMGRRTDRDRL